jgi:hypothetical protein
MGFIDTKQGLNVAWSSETGCGLAQPLNQQYNPTLRLAMRHSTAGTLGLWSGFRCAWWRR